jgi:cysteine desulfurase / selenocysteine lyase
MRQDDFPIFRKRLTYLDTAATAQKPQAVIDAERQFYEEEYGTVHRAVYNLCVHATDRVEAVRQQVAAFINAPDDAEVIFTKGTTDAINLVASSFGRHFVDMGDEVIISELEHHSNIVPWQLMCEQRGAILHILPVNDRGELLLDQLDQMMTSRTKLVSIAHIVNSIGTLNPIEKVVEIAHAHGAKVLVDGAQAAGHIPIDVQRLGADFYTFSGHKMYGPTGIGILWGRRELLEEIPPYQGGGDMIERVTFEETTYGQLPLRFEAGTPNIAGIIGLGAAISYIEGIGFEKIQCHEEQLIALALERLSPYRLFGHPERRGSIIAFGIEDLHPLDIGTLLNLKGIALRTGHLCAQPAMNRFGVEAMCRLSLGLYNEAADIERLAEALPQVIQDLSGGER